MGSHLAFAVAAGENAAWSAVVPIVVAAIALGGVVLTIAWTRALEHSRWKRQVFATFAGTATDTFYRCMYFARLQGTHSAPDRRMTQLLADLDRQMHAAIAEIEILDPSVRGAAEAVQDAVVFALEDVHKADYVATSPYEQMQDRERHFLEQRAAFITDARRSLGLRGGKVPPRMERSAGRWLPD